MRKIVMLFALLGGFTFISGCQPTPEESAVVSKLEGLDKESIAEPLKNDETVTIDIPQPWKVSEKRSADRVRIEADLRMDEIKVGNLPVMEMKNHEMSAEELEKLVEYFAGDEKLYQPETDTRKDYQKEIECIKNREGAYADPVLYSVYQSRVEGLEEALELAPEKESFTEINKIDFTEKTEDKAWEKVQAATLTEEELESMLKKRKQDIYFEADAGQERTSHIQAENYRDTLANSSYFKWWTGDISLNEETIQRWITTANVNAEGIGNTYYLQRKERLEDYEKLVKQESFQTQEGLEKAEIVLKELGIRQMKLSHTQKALWFPDGTFSNYNIELLDSQILSSDLENAETGYEFTFTRGFGGLSAGQLQGSVVGDTASGVNAYAPPFPVEKISVVVTKSGVRSFIWEGICEEAGTVAENTKLLAFEDIEKRLLDYIYYSYTMLAQPADNKTKFTYTIYDLSLGYTYVPAFKNPQNAWLVPAWFVKAKEYIDAKAEGGKAYERGTVEVMVNALDGGLIAYPDS
ncbi:MAG: DUF6034 family protein [Eubacteriales bacterium]|nr:DUF6034 family protein [Eubacteriales bacterium]